VTLLGPGGTGKTRVAFQFASQYSKAVNASVYFVDLTDVTTQDAFVHQVSNTVGREHSAEDPMGIQIQELASHIGRMDAMLLILDNFEQVPEECALQIAHWARNNSALQVLATSRQPLRVTGEQRVVLPPLDHASAVQLFVDRANAVQADFQRTTGNQDMLDEVVQRLDCLPLAIELAAARLNVLSLPILSRRLSKRLDLLVGRKRDQVHRQKTLRATLDWSWDLLTPEEQATFIQCGLFAGGFSLTAAEAVVSLEHLDPSLYVLDLVESLHEKSLVRVSETTEDPEGIRFSMLETIREYALERLRNTDLYKETVARHRVFFLEIGKRLQLGAYGKVGSLNQLRLERENLVMVNRLAVGEDPNAVIATAVNLDVLLSEEGPFELQIELLQNAVDCSENAAPEHRVTALAARGRARRHRGLFNEAQADLKLAAKLASDAGLADAEGRVLTYLGTLMWARLRLPAAYDLYQRALRIFQEQKDQRQEAATLLYLQIMNLETGRFNKAREFGAEAVKLNRRVNNHVYAALSRQYLGAVDMAEGNLEAAHEQFKRALDQLESLEVHGTAGSTLTDIGLCYHLQGQLSQAEKHYRRAHTCLSGSTDRRVQGHAYTLLGTLLADQGQAEAATQTLETGWTICNRIHDARGLACLNIARGNVELAQAREAREKGAQDRAKVLIGQAHRRLIQPITSTMTASAPTGIPLANISQDVRWMTQLLQNAHERSATSTDP